MIWFDREHNNTSGGISGDAFLGFPMIRFSIMNGLIDFTTYKLAMNNPSATMYFKHKHPGKVIATAPVLNIKLHSQHRGIFIKLRKTSRIFFYWDDVFDEIIKNNSILGYTVSGNYISEISFDYKVPALHSEKVKIVEKPVIVEKLVTLPFEEALRLENERLYKSLEGYVPTKKDENNELLRIYG